ncbi:VWA domain-containing protein [Methanospirillum sp. J.3.6.1-F.2.7.3]|uniref:VWA domain-containing protein n=1 Tax=Methanospirillum purgamenti TaxID=2834276 RepID=A0A8E7B2B7_9EURY|nr:MULTISPECIES: VWA domain-containing protein [Methanospirillum]MDX8551797.1 VWA domain-containing protein [Methanospirillum hungatei]QVV89193.1 VWA domain-containing protein [Methanospirillum sp. J.3.6.1-F.2.7.3]
MAYGKRDSSGRLVFVRFVLSEFCIGLLIIFLCYAFAGPALAVGPDFPGGVMVQPVKAVPALPSGGSGPSQSVPQLLDRSVVSPERSSLVQPGFVSGPVMGRVSVPDVSLPGGVSGLNEITPPVASIKNDGNVSTEAFVQPDIGFSLIIDSSGSMSWNDRNNLRLTASKSMAKLINILNRDGASHSLALVDFDSSSELKFSMNRVDEDNIETILEEIDKIKSSGGTCIPPALQMGYDQLLSKEGTYDKGCAILLTDGEDGCSGAINKVQQFVNKGWPIFTIGLSSDADIPLLKQISSASNGQNYPISVDGDITGIFLDILKKIGLIETTKKQTITLIGGETEEITYIDDWPPTIMVKEEEGGTPPTPKGEGPNGPVEYEPTDLGNGETIFTPKDEDKNKPIAKIIYKNPDGNPKTFTQIIIIPNPTIRLFTDSTDTYYKGNSYSINAWLERDNGQKISPVNFIDCTWTLPDGSSQSVLFSSVGNGMYKTNFVPNIVGFHQMTINAQSGSLTLSKNIYFNVVESTAPDIEWEKILTGNNYDVGNGLILSDNDGFVITGYSDSTNGDYTGNNGGYDIFIKKYSLTGNLLWSKMYGASIDDAMYSVKQVSDGGFVLAGDTNSNAGEFKSKGSYDGAILKIDKNGNKQWVKTIGGTGGDTARDVFLADDGTFILTGFGSSNNGDLPGNLGPDDGFVRKYDVNGNVIWTKLYHNYGDDEFHTIIPASDGGFVVGGFSNTGMSGYHGAIDFNVFKYDKNGIMQWGKPYGGKNNDYLNQIITSHDGGYILAGNSWSNDGDSGQVVGHHGDWDAWIAKIDANGNFVDQVCLGGSNGQGAYGIASTSDGGYIVVCDTRANDGDVSGMIGTRDIWVVKLSSSLDIQWQKCLGKSGVESSPQAVVEANDGGYIILGQNAKSGSQDVWIIKLKPEHTLSPPVVSSITPSTAQNTGTATISNLAGTGFKTGAKVSLKRSGYADIPASNVVVSSPNKITCRFPLSDKNGGAWNVVVTNTDGHIGTKYGGFSITGGTGSYNIGVFRGSKWYLDSSGNGAWGAGDKTHSFGLSNDVPVTGDWNGDGKRDIGVFRGRTWYLDSSGNGAWGAGDKTYTFGLSGDKPVTGDWNKDGKTDIGVFRGNKWYLDSSGNGAWGVGDKTYSFGLSGDIPVTGVWNKDGKTDIGVFRGNKWYLDSSGNGAWGSGDKTYTFGLAGDKPITGDWNKDGKTDIGVFRGNKWYLDSSGNGAWGAGDKTYTFGLSGDTPVTGKWSGSSGTASIQSVELNPLEKPDSVFEVPDVTRPVAAVPVVEMPVNSNSVKNTVTPGVVPSQPNPLVSGQNKIPGNPLL